VSVDLIKNIRRLFKSEHYRLTLHAEIERDHDLILMTDIEECFQSDRIELLEDYPNDPRGHSSLILGFSAKKEPIHFVCAIHDETLIFITLYRPDRNKWTDFKTRKK
jgi:hypothetical protein